MDREDLLELTADIVSSHVSMTEMSSDDLLKELKAVYATLEGLGKGEIEIPTQEPKKRGRKPKAMVEATAEGIKEEKTSTPSAPAMTIEEAFKPDQVACMICGKKGLTTLKRHLSTAHDLKPGKYRKQFNIPKDQPLAATDYVAKRRQSALDRGLGDKLAAARAARKAKQTGE
jgi:predicted transcriptional regulator